jgi:hypothetical protein
VFKALTRVLLTLVVLGALLWIFAPRLFSNAANSFITSADAQAQGLAEYVPPGALSSSKQGDLQVQLNGLTPSTTYEVTLDQGTCGSTWKDLGSVTSDSNGNFYFELPLASLDTKSTWFVDVLQQNLGNSSVACGQLQTNQDSSSQIINAPLSGPNVFGPQPTSGDQNGATPTAPTTGGSGGTTGTGTPNGLPNTGANPGNNQQYDNNKYPRKY